MDFSEKDAARSKWRLTQKNRRGRGRGSGAPGIGARGGRGSSAGAADLGTNEDRYYDAEAEQQAAAAALGPVQQSQGADLAELLSQAEPFDQAFYFRSRVNLAQDVGLPPETSSGSYQGLAFDLKGLATCLELLPKNQLLGTNAFSDEEEGEEESEKYLPDLEQPGEQPAAGVQTTAVVSSTRAQVGASQPLVHEPPPRQQPLAPSAASLAAAVPQQEPAPAVAAAADDDVDDLLSELLGEKAGIDSSRSSSSSGAAPKAAQHRQQPAQQAAAARPQQAALPSAAAPQQVAVQQRQEPAGMGAADDEDAELDMLLGLSSAPAGSSGASRSGAGLNKAPRHQHQQPPTPPQQQQSLEDWLEGL